MKRIINTFCSNRWVTYEEKLEESDRWSKPHMPTTSFQALDSLRRGVEEQTLDLDLNTTDDTEFYEIMGKFEFVKFYGRT